MQYMGFCDCCKKLKILTRYKVSGDEDLCIDCHANKEYERLMSKEN